MTETTVAILVAGVIVAFALVMFLMERRAAAKRPAHRSRECR